MDERPQTAPPGTSPGPFPAPAPAHDPSPTAPTSPAPVGAAEAEAQRRLQQDTGSIEPIDVEIARPAVPSADEQSPSTPIAPIPAVKAATVDVIGYASPGDGTSFSNEVISFLSGDSGAVRQAIVAAREVGIPLLGSLGEKPESITTPYI